MESFWLKMQINDAMLDEETLPFAVLCCLSATPHHLEATRRCGSFWLQRIEGGTRLPLLSTVLLLFFFAFVRRRSPHSLAAGRCCLLSHQLAILFFTNTHILSPYYYYYYYDY